MTGTRKQRSEVAMRILEQAEQILAIHGEYTGYQDEVDEMPYETVAAILGELLQNLPTGGRWVLSIPDPKAA